MADETTETHETPDGGTETTTTTHTETKDENLITEEKTATTEANQI